MRQTKNLITVCIKSYAPFPKEIVHTNQSLLNHAALHYQS